TGSGRQPPTVCGRTRPAAAGRGRRRLLPQRSRRRRQALRGLAAGPGGPGLLRQARMAVRPAGAAGEHRVRGRGRGRGRGGRKGNGGAGLPAPPSGPAGAVGPDRGPPHQPREPGRRDLVRALATLTPGRAGPSTVRRRRRRPDPPYASAFCLIWSNSAWVIVPLASSWFAFSISLAALPAPPAPLLAATVRMRSSNCACAAWTSRFLRSAM